MDTILSGEAAAEGIGALLAGLSIKGESPAEVAAIATSMRARMVPVTLGKSVLAAGGALDIVGTGGDNSGSGTLRRGLVVHTDGLDEFSTAGIAEVAEFGGPDEGGAVRRYRFDAAAACGLRRATVADLRGGDAAHNARVLCEVWRGERDDAIADAIALNAGVGVYASGGAPTIEAGVRRAQEVMASGAPMRVMDAWRAVAVREADAEERAAVGA
eukprot:contig_28690_g7058